MDETIKDKIIDATIRLMHTKDMKSIPIRLIASEAGVNSAAISYYFQGKVPLFREAMSRYWSEMIAIYQDILAQDTISDAQAVQFCLQILSFELNSTGILRSEQSMYIDFDMDQETKERIQLQLQAMTHMVHCLAPKTQQQLIFAKVISTITSLSGPALFPEATISEIKNLEEQKRLYAKQIVINIKS